LGGCERSAPRLRHSAPGRRPRYPLYRRLAGPRSRFGRYARREEKTQLSLPEMESGALYFKYAHYYTFFEYLLIRQNYWVSALCPSSGILKIREQNVSETGCFHFQVRGETLTLLGPLERANLNRRATHVSITIQTGFTKFYIYLILCIGLFARFVA
jgi:hypothetical protein